MITSVYRAKVKKFFSGEETLRDQSRKAHDYYNRLIELKLRKRAEYRSIRANHFPELAAVEEQLVELGESARRLSKEQSAKRKALYSEQKRLRAEFKEKMGAASVAYFVRTNEGAPKTAAKGARNREVFLAMDTEPEWPVAWKELKKLDIDAHAEAIQLRADSALTQGTYIAIENAVAQAEKTSLLDPRFRPWQRGNTCDWRKVGIQIQGGLDVPCLRGDVGKIRFVRVWDQVRGEQHTNGHPPTKRKKRRAEVLLQLGKGLPAIRFEIMMWRPLPEDAKITWVYLVPDLRGGWELQFTLNTQRRLVERQIGRGAVRIESVGDRNEAGRVVVARVDGDEYLLPSRIEDKLVGAEALRSASDRHFDEIVQSVLRWIAREGLLPWMIEENEKGHTLVGHMRKWSGHWRMHRLVSRWCNMPEMYAAHWTAWRKERHAAGLDLYGTEGESVSWAEARGIAAPFCWHLYTWTRKDIHLQQFEDGRRQSAIRARKAAYRALAAKLSESYEFVSLADVSLSEKASEEKRKKGELRDSHNPRVLASCYEFEDAIKLAFGRERWSGGKKAPTTRKAPKALKGVSSVLPQREDAAE